MNFPVPSRNYLGDDKRIIGDYIDKFTRFWNDHNQGKLTWDNVNATAATITTLTATTGLFGDGTVGAPGIAFSSDTDVGWYRVGANNPALSAGNVKVIDAKSTGVAILGTTTNDSAATGFIGEYVVGTASSLNAGTTGQYTDGTSISLTAGDWSLSAMMDAVINTATWSTIILGISTTSGNSSTGLVGGDNLAAALWSNSAATPQRYSLVIPSYRMSLSATTTVYLKTQTVYSAGQPVYNGLRLSALRVR
jgi:hypothetical protein